MTSGARGGPAARPPSLTGRLLQRAVGLSCVRPALTILVAAGFAALGIGYAAHSLTLDTSKFHLLPLHRPYATLYKDYAEDFGQLEDIVVVVESPTVETSTAYAARLAGVLREGALGTARVSYRIDASRLEAQVLLYLPLDTLRDTLDAVASHEDLLADFAATPTLDRLVEGINQYVGATFLPGALGPGAEEKTGAVPTRLLRDLLTQMSARIDGGQYHSPWGGLIAAPAVAPDGGYFLSDDRRLLYVVIDLADAPRTFAAEHATIVAVRQAIASLRPQFPSVEAGVTGAPALFSDELSAAARDSKIAGALALVLTLGLLWLAFRRIGTACALLAVLVVSLGWSLGVITLLVGRLTIFSMMFVSVAIALGTDYGVYLLFRYREEQTARGARDALERAAARSGPGILLGAVAAALTFYLLTMAEFRGIRDFGFVSGTAVLLAFLSMVTVFPAVLALIERRRTVPGLAPIAGDRDAPPSPDAQASARGGLPIPALESLVRYPRTILVAAALVTGASLLAAPRVGFDYNVLNLQADGTESVVWEKKAAATAGRSVFAALSTASTLAELGDKQAAFQRLPSVSDVQSVLSVLPDRQAEKLTVLQRLGDVADSIHLGPPRPLDLRALTTALETLKRRMDFVTASAGADGAAGEEVRAISQATTALLRKLTATDRGAVEVALADYQARLASDFAQQWRRLQLAARPGPVALSDLPEELRRRFIGKSGQLLLQMYSKLDLWERPSQARFVEELRTVDPNVTGQPIVAYESMRVIERTFRLTLVSALALITAIAGLVIRRVRETVLAMVPLILGTLWALAVMPLVGLKFNLVNMWALPLIVGAAAEYGVNIVLRALDVRAHGVGSFLARSTVMGVVLNGLTTMAGFGSLLIAHHRGVRSLGLLLVIGSAMSLIAALVVLPTVMRLTGAAPAPSDAGEGSAPAPRGARVEAGDGGRASRPPPADAPA